MSRLSASETILAAVAAGIIICAGWFPLAVFADTLLPMAYDSATDVASFPSANGVAIWISVNSPCSAFQNGGSGSNSLTDTPSFYGDTNFWNGWGPYSYPYNIYYCYTTSGSSYSYLQLTGYSVISMTASHQGVFQSGGTIITANVPADQSVVATSTTMSIGATGSITAGDFLRTQSVTIEVYNEASRVALSSFAIAPLIAGGGTGSVPYDETFILPISASGSFSVSTTTSISEIGNYYVSSSIRVPSTTFLGFSFGGADYLSTLNTTFTAATTSTMDAFAASSTQSQSVLTNAVFNLESGCTSIVTTPLACFALYVVPSQDGFNQIATSIYNNFLTRPPFGYITRFWAILGGGVVTEPPALSYTFGSSSPAVLQGKSYSVQIWDYVGSTSPILQARADDGSNKDIWDIVDPYWSVIVAFAVLGSILADTIGFALEQASSIDSDWRMQERAAAAQSVRNTRMYQSTITNRLGTRRDYTDYKRSKRKN